MTPSKMSVPGKRSIFAASAILLGLCLSVLFAELLARRVSPTYRRMHDPPHPFFKEHPTRGWELVPGYDGREVWKVRFRVNSLGFRGPAPDHGLGESFRVLVLGDSIAMGSGFPEEVIVSSRLERLLESKYPGRKFDVLNAGIAGYDIEEERLLLQEEGLALRPDAVALIACLNDIPGTSPADHVNPLRDLPVPGKKWLLQNSALAMLARSLYHRMGIESGRAPYFLRAESDPETMARIESGWEEFRRHLLAMTKQSRDAGAVFILVLVPHAAQFEDARERFLPQARMAKICKELGVEFIDLAPVFSSSPMLPYIAPDPVHPGPAGHRVMAELIAESLGPFIKQED